MMSSIKLSVISKFDIHAEGKFSIMNEMKQYEI